MKIIIGQGNPGKEYAKTRHNIGFMMLDELTKHFKVSWQAKTKWQAEVAELNFDNEKVLLVKPTCFYNLTGQAVRQIGDFYKISFAQDLLVIHDDLALDLGTIRVRKTGSDGGNNGLKSIISHIGHDFWRIRIGTKTPLADKMDSADFVLSKLSFREKRQLKSLSTEIIDQTSKFISSQMVETSINVLK